MHVLSQLKLPAQIEHLTNIVEFVSKCSKEQGFDPKRIQEIELALEEVVVNVLNYAYKHKIGDVQVICGIDDDDRFIIEIIDSGIAFDPLSAENPELSAGISDREVGGLGVFLVKQLMDDIHYRRDGDKNILRLTVRKEEDHSG